MSKIGDYLIQSEIDGKVLFNDTTGHYIKLGSKVSTPTGIQCKVVEIQESMNDSCIKATHPQGHVLAPGNWFKHDA